jgi:hypothetical protein
MVKRFGVSSVVIAAALASAVAAPAAAESDGKARAVIRGSGKDVSIVYRAPLSSAPPRASALASDPLGEALRRKRSGADDAALVDYLRQNQAGLPDVVDAGTIRQLRRAGAGDSVIATLASYAAVDIGPTSDDAAAPPAPAPESGSYGAGFPDLANMGYPFYGGYGGGFYGGGYDGHNGRFGNHVAHHGARGFGGNGFHPRQPFFQFHQPMAGHARPMPSRGGPAPHRLR